MRVLLLNAHPDSGSYCDAITDAYLRGAIEADHEAVRIHLRELRFDLVLRGGYRGEAALEPDLLEQQRLIRWCEHLVIVTPNWWWSAPALLKGYIDRVFTPDFAMRYRDRFPYVEPLLTNRSARIIYTQNAPRLVGFLFRSDLFWKWAKRAVLGHCGFRPVRRAMFGPVGTSTPEARSRFLARVYEHGRAAR